MRRDPKERKQEKRAKASAELNDWLKNSNLGEIAIAQVDDDGHAKMLTLEQINNFEW